MKFSHAWLGEYADIDESPEHVARRLTATGIAVDAVEAPSAGAPEGEAVYDVDVPPNRADCMCHLGLAREYAASRGSLLRPPATAPFSAGPATAASASVTIEVPDLCSRYSARCVLGVRVGPSPDWLRRRLESIGQRSINNVVDATNFVLWEIGHPLHPFDLERLEGRRIVVRLARAGEILVTLDGVERRLTPEMLIIADDRRPVALAGIMGGRSSEIGPGTRDVLIESAWFDPIAVRRAGRALGLHTDASHRFERGADQGATLAALDRAAALIAEIAGGAVTDPPADQEPRPRAVRIVPFRPQRARALLGVPLDGAAIGEALRRLSFEVRDPGPDTWKVTVPSFRSDVTREADLIEEVARHRGYDAIPSALPLLPDSGEGLGPAARRAALARSALMAAGLSEAINYSMVTGDEHALFDPDGPAAVALENPLQSQAACLRGSLFPGLLRNVAHNLNHAAPSCHLFEVGTAFRSGRPAPEERTLLAWVFAGRGLPAHWSAPRREVDLFDARGAVELMADLLGLSPLRFSSDKIPFLRPGAALALSREDRRLGVAGELAPEVLRHFGIERPVFGVEIDLGLLLREPADERRYRALPRHPAARRDLALVVGPDVNFEAIERVVRDAARLPIAAVQVFDRYQGAGVPPGCASLAIQVVFLHPERTLEAEEVQTAQDAIVAALSAKLGVGLRGTPQV